MLHRILSCITVPQAEHRALIKYPPRMGTPDISVCLHWSFTLRCHDDVGCREVACTLTLVCVHMVILLHKSFHSLLKEFNEVSLLYISCLKWAHEKNLKRPWHVSFKLQGEAVSTQSLIATTFNSLSVIGIRI